MRGWKLILGDRIRVGGPKGVVHVSMALRRRCTEAFKAGIRDGADWGGRRGMGLDFGEPGDKKFVRRNGVNVCETE